jgi:hypothetical protein
MYPHRHIFQFPFTVISGDPYGRDVSGADIRAAILAAVSRQNITDEELEERVGSPEESERIG